MGMDNNQESYVHEAVVALSGFDAEKAIFDTLYTEGSFCYTEGSFCRYGYGDLCYNMAERFSRHKPRRA